MDIDIHNVKAVTVREVFVSSSGTASRRIVIATQDHGEVHVILYGDTDPCESLTIE